MNTDILDAVASLGLGQHNNNSEPALEHPSPVAESFIESIPEEEADSILSSYGFSEGIISEEIGVVTVGQGIIEQTSHTVEIPSPTDIVSSYNNDNEEDVDDWDDDDTEFDDDTEENAEDDSAEEPQYPQLPPNPAELTYNDTTARFSGAEWFEAVSRQNILIAGIGGIGSNLVYQIARMGPNKIFIYDDDKVEAVNMSGQLFSSADIGRYKVDAIASMASLYANSFSINAIRSRFTEESLPCNIMMCGFDNMTARKTFYYKWKERLSDFSVEKYRANCLFLDGRLSMDTLQVFCITGNDLLSMEKYEKEYLFDDSEADATVCSMKQTTYLASMIGSVMTNLFINFVANTLEPFVPYYLPFFTEYDATRMKFRTE